MTGRNLSQRDTLWSEASESTGTEEAPVPVLMVARLVAGVTMDPTQARLQAWVSKAEGIPDTRVKPARPEDILVIRALARPSQVPATLVQHLEPLKVPEDTPDTLALVLPALRELGDTATVVTHLSRSKAKASQEVRDTPGRTLCSLPTTSPRVLELVDLCATNSEITP